MNFKKNKDIKRASYYVWYLGAKESKGLRGDEYVTPVLNYLLDNECDLEPSKVTLQVSNKGLKIIQILTVPRKSAKLNADQQTQLFASSHRLKTDPLPSSVLKTEQVKHHIPHNSITWVYQEDDVICAILLLYNPITRCPVHVHAYRCDSIETADNLRQQLQTLVDRPENQKKFREIESRLAAKGLLLPPPLPPAPSSQPPSHGYPAYADDPDHTAPHHPHHHHYSSPSTSKTLNSDGRSTRTEGSDENSEESNSSDLGYAVRSKSNRVGGGPGPVVSSAYKQHYQHHPPPPPPIMPHSLPSDSKKSSHLSSSSNHHHQSMDLFKPKSKSSSKNKSLPKPSETEPELPTGVTAALYDSLAAELRAKLGNPKMGPILLPPRDYDGKNSAEAGKKASNDRHHSSPLSRSESSGKSSSGIGSDEALSGENQKNRNYYRGYERIEKHLPYPNVDSSPSMPYEVNRRSNRYSYYEQTDSGDKPLYSLQPTYSSDEEVDFDCDDILDVDVEDFEEDVIFTPGSQQKSKSTFDLFQHRTAQTDQHQHHQSPQQSNKYYRSRQRPLDHSSPIDIERKTKNVSNMAKMYASNPNLSRTPFSKEVKACPEKNVIGRREQRTMQLHQQSSGLPRGSGGGRAGDMMMHHRQSNSKMSDRKVAEAGGNKSASRTPPVNKYYFADTEFSDQSRYNQSGTKFHETRYLGRSSGNLASIEYEQDRIAGPMSFVSGGERPLSPGYFYRHNNNHNSVEMVPRNAKSSRVAESHNKSQSQSRGDMKNPTAMARKRLEQPHSRYSYIDIDHHRYQQSATNNSGVDSRFGAFLSPPIRR